MEDCSYGSFKQSNVCAYISPIFQLFKNWSNKNETNDTARILLLNFYVSTTLSILHDCQALARVTYEDFIRHNAPQQVYSERKMKRRHRDFDGSDVNGNDHCK